MELNALFKGIKAEFMTLMETPQLKPYDPLVMRVNSQSNQEDYWIPLAAGSVRKLLDTVQFRELFDRKMTIVNETYYDSVREDRNTIMDSQEYLSANVQAQINQVVGNWKSYEVTLVDKLIADNGTAFDGQAFFSTATRSNISSAISSTGLINQTSGAGTTTTLIMDDIAVAKTALLSYKDSNQKYFNDPNNAKFMFLVPVHLQDTFKRILSPTANIVNVAGAAVSNPYAGLGDIVIYNTVTTKSDWILCNANASVKPWILQSRQDPEWEMRDDRTTKYVDYWYTARMGAGYGSPFAAHRITNG